MTDLNKVLGRYWPVFILVFSTLIWAQEQYSVDDAPGPLSTAHKDTPGLKNCSQCHSADLDVVSTKCLSCHREIAGRISAKRGFHRDKAESCSDCHTEHEGEETKLVEWDVTEFDHKETGYALIGSHKKITDCLACHTKDNSVPRKTTVSYLLKDSRCLVCHPSPHPGDQDNCQACHSPDGWRVEIWKGKAQ